MPWGALVQDSVALLVYPGLLASAMFGLAVEATGTRLLGGRSSFPRGLWPALRAGRLSPVEAAVALLAALSASQLALPFNPLSPTERNVLIAAVALVSASWLVRGGGREKGGRGGAPLALVAEGCWLIALMAPALVSQSLRPQVLGAVVLISLVPLKLVAAALYLLCLPVLLQLLPEMRGEAEDGAGVERPARFLLWLPTCGLFASVYVPAPGDAVLAVLAYAVATVGAAAVAYQVTSVLVRWRLVSARTAYMRLGLVLALVTLLLAVVAEATT